MDRNTCDLVKALARLLRQASTAIDSWADRRIRALNNDVPNNNPRDSLQQLERYIREEVLPELNELRQRDQRRTSHATNPSEGYYVAATASPAASLDDERASAAATDTTAVERASAERFITEPPLWYTEQPLDSENDFSE